MVSSEGERGGADPGMQAGSRCLPRTWEAFPISRLWTEASPSDTLLPSSEFSPFLEFPGTGKLIQSWGAGWGELKPRISLLSGELLLLLHPRGPRNPGLTGVRHCRPCLYLYLPPVGI